jgi:hypothetical protein
VRSIFFKELRDHRAALGAQAAIGLLNLFDLLEGDTERLTALDSVVSECEMLLLFAFAITSGVLAREREEGTLAFLDGLPTSRTRIYFAKGLAAWVALWPAPLITIGWSVVMAYATRTSQWSGLHGEWVLAQVAAQLICALVGVSAGLMLGQLGSLAWASFALVCGVVLNLQHKFPRLSEIDPTTIGSLLGTFHQPSLPARGYRGALVMSATALVIGWFAFRSASQSSRRSSRTWVSALVGLLTIGAVVFVASQTKNKDEPPAREPVAGVKVTQLRPGHAETGHYRMTYPGERSHLAQMLLPKADAVFEEVAQRFEPVDTGKVEVEMFGSMDNTAGTAFWGKIRMNLGRDAEAVLAHETTHVLAERLVGIDASDQLARMAVFNEGLAHWVENQHTLHVGVNEQDRRVAGLIHRRRTVDFPRLIDDQAFARDFDQDLKYPLGGVLVEALVQRYGEKAPREVLAALGDKRLPHALKPMERWQAGFQLAGFDLDQVLARYATLTAGYDAALLPADVPPRPRAFLVSRDGAYGLEVRLDAPLVGDSSVLVRVRPKPSSPLDAYRIYTLDVDQLAWPDPSRITGDRLCYQAGVRVGGTVLFEPWECSPLKDASPID